MFTPFAIVAAFLMWFDALRPFLMALAPLETDLTARPPGTKSIAVDAVPFATSPTAGKAFINNTIYKKAIPLIK
ncbi:hypothetical protein, partial [Streptomyces sp. NPDC059131]|uniref:hypothetical protein n=1 Tax=Streptomyces sp. NPDC059131 TaxID=3346736 RepID=UPI00368D09F6